eukprot:5145_1
MSTNIMMSCIYGCGAYINRDQSHINDNNGVCRYARNKQKKHNYQAIEYSVAVSKIRASHKHTRKCDRPQRPTVGSNHIQVLRTSEGVVPYATAVGRFPRNDNVEHYAHQERYALNQKKLIEEPDETKQATKAMMNETNKVKQNNEHYAPDNDEDISTVYNGSLNGDRRGRQLPISGRSRRHVEISNELNEEKQANIAKSDEFNQVNQRHVQISNELNRVKQTNAQMRQDNQAMLAELNRVKQSYAQLQHVNHQLSNILSNHPRSG